MGDLEAARRDFLKSHPTAESLAQLHAKTAQAWEGQSRKDLALQEWEHALAADPLNLAHQQRYWALKKPRA